MKKKKPNIRPLKFKMVEIRHLEKRHDVNFLCWRRSNFDKILRLVHNDTSTAVLWSKSKPEAEFQYGRLLGNSLACHPRSTCHIAGWKNSIRHIANCFSPYFIFFGFLNVIWAFVSSGFRIVSDTLVTFVTVCETVIAIVNNLSE